MKPFEAALYAAARAVPDLVASAVDDLQAHKPKVVIRATAVELIGQLAGTDPVALACLAAHAIVEAAKLRRTADSWPPGRRWVNEQLAAHAARVLTPSVRADIEHEVALDRQAEALDG